MENERSVDRLARYLVTIGKISLICLACWLLRSMLIYIVLAAVMALIAKPVMKVLKRRLRLGKVRLPDWLCALLTIAVMVCLLFGFITMIIPIVIGIVQQISTNIQASAFSIPNVSTAIDDINQWIIGTFPQAGPDFSIQASVTSFIGKAMNFSSLSQVLGSIASTIGSLGLGIFCVFFISFFFIKEEGLFTKIVCALVPDRLEKKAASATGNIEHLLSRYFFGIICEILIVTLLDFFGVLLVAGLNFSTALGIGFMCGLFNVIPYIGPWLGGALGAVLGVSLKYSAAAAVGGTFNFWLTLASLAACFIVTQWIDNFFLQPMIYSKSIKSSPLEIFIVIILAGQIGGVIGMVAAIPAYTVIRVIAAEFFYDIKAIRRLIPAQDESIETQNDKE